MGILFQLTARVRCLRFPHQGYGDTRTVERKCLKVSREEEAEVNRGYVIIGDV